jgi:starch synthase
MPRYRQIPWHDTEPAYEGMVVYAGAIPYRVDIRQIVHGGVRFFFVEAPYFFDRDGIYNWRGVDFGDNHRRFSLLSLAALGLHQTVWQCDILHCHDWQAALVPVYKADQQHSNPLFYGVRTVLTIHNLGYQGRFGRQQFDDLGLNPGWFSPDKLEYYGDVNILKGGIAMADWLTTVSPTYAREIQTPEGGFGLDGILRARSAALTGILNGADYSVWNPATDPHIAANYSPEDLAGKRECKLALLRMFNLPEDRVDERPLIGIVSRFAAQKGFDLIARAAKFFHDQDVQFVILGSGDKEYERIFNEWRQWLPNKIGVWIGHNEKLAHQIEAGADIFLMPSLYEPCGLNQIYSLKYGTVPVVRATGGLDDTIQEDTGFKFSEYSAEALESALQRAIEAFADRERWRQMMLRGMAQDFSWTASARSYSKLYRALLGQA